jgi:hypothetical protein
MNGDYMPGFGLLFLGIFTLWFTIKSPEKGRDIWLLDFKGYAGGIGCILVGIVFIWKAFHKH